MAFLSLVSVASAEVKIGMVDLNRALQETKAGKTAKSGLEKEIQSKQKKVEDKQKDFEKLRSEYQKKSMVLGAEARGEKEAELQQKAMEIQKMMQEYDVAMRQKEASVTKPIIDGLRELLPEISRSRKVDMVVEKNAGVLYAVDVTDMTEELIREYDKKNK